MLIEFTARTSHIIEMNEDSPVAFIPQYTPIHCEFTEYSRVGYARAIVEGEKINFEIALTEVIFPTIH